MAGTIALPPSTRLYFIVRSSRKPARDLHIAGVSLPVQHDNYVGHSALRGERATAGPDMALPQ